MCLTSGWDTHSLGFTETDGGPWSFRFVFFRWCPSSHKKMQTFCGLRPSTIDRGPPATLMFTSGVANRQ
jgi:hypothetical protein